MAGKLAGKVVILAGATSGMGRETALLFAREGANIVAPGHSTDGPYGGQPMVYQRYAELPRVDGRYPVLGSWVVGGVPCGLGIREDATPITTDASRFVPHCFDPAAKGLPP